MHLTALISVSGPRASSPRSAAPVSHMRYPRRPWRRKFRSLPEDNVFGSRGSRAPPENNVFLNLKPRALPEKNVFRCRGPGLSRKMMSSGAGGCRALHIRLEGGGRR